MANIFYKQPMENFDRLIDFGQVDMSNTGTYQEFLNGDRALISNQYTSISNNTKTFTITNSTTCVWQDFTQDQKTIINNMCNNIGYDNAYEAIIYGQLTIALDTTHLYPYYFSLLDDYATNHKLNLGFCLKDSFWGASSDSFLVIDYYFTNDGNIAGILIVPTYWYPDDMNDMTPPLYFHIIYNNSISQMTPITYEDIGAAYIIHTHNIKDFTGIAPTSVWGTGKDFSKIENNTIFYHNMSTGWDAISNPSTITGTTYAGLYSTADEAKPQWGIVPVEQGGTGVTTEKGVRILSGKWKYAGDTITLSSWFTAGAVITNSRTHVRFCVHLPYRLSCNTITTTISQIYVIGQGTSLSYSNLTSSTTPAITTGFKADGTVIIQLAGTFTSFPYNNDAISVRVVGITFTLS